jgi:hypothetical protein
MGDKLRNTKRKSGMSKDALIKELKKIRLFKDEFGRRLINPLTKTQRKIFAPFGLGEENVKKYKGKKCLISPTKICSQCMTPFLRFASLIVGVKN